MKDYYYIKFKSLEYDEAPLFLTEGGLVRCKPNNLKIFDSFEEALKYKRAKLADEDYQQSYMFEYYEISIERL